MYQGLKRENQVRYLPLLQIKRGTMSVPERIDNLYLKVITCIFRFLRERRLLLVRQLDGWLLKSRQRVQASSNSTPCLFVSISGETRFVKAGKLSYF